MKKEIAVCRSCFINGGKIIPMIWTFVFNGAERWCPYCGMTTGMFGYYKSVISTKALREALLIYQVFSKEYLDGMGGLTCSELRINGKDVSRENFTPELIAELQAKRDKGWELGVEYKFLNDVSVVNDKIERVFNQCINYFTENINRMKRDFKIYQNGTDDLYLGSLDTLVEESSKAKASIDELIQLLPILEKRSLSPKFQRHSKSEKVN